ncbi:MAG: hypothetical protein ACI867_000508 [Glaciecola sp.]|jgi:hypothetical protein
MTTIVLLVLGAGFALLALTGWRARAAANPASSVEGFARVLAAIDPDHRGALDPIEAIDELPSGSEVPDLGR